ncbi:MAG: hypothetical protein ACOYMZ_02975 [Minisyncoccia bacterium]
MNEHFPSPENNFEQSKIKEGVDLLFEIKPELGAIGTKEQYSSYIESIFPASKVKEILWHTSNVDFEHFDVSKSGSGTYGTGIYFDKELRGEDAPFKYPAVVDLENPLEISHKTFKDKEELDRIFDVAYDFLDVQRELKKEEVSEEEKGNIIIDILFGATTQNLSEYKNNFPSLEGINSIEEYIRKIKVLTGKDGVIQHRDSDFETVQEYIVFDQSQIHILGSKSDKEKFKEFVG